MLGVQMWRCKVCNKLGTYKSNMLRHTMTHTGERPHPCRFCSQSFSISSNRHRHEKKCKLNPNPSLEALVPSLLNQFNGHPATGGPGRPPHHRVGPLAAGALMGPGAFPGFPGGFPALPPPEGLGKPSHLHKFGQRHDGNGDSDPLHEQKPDVGDWKKNSDGGHGGHRGGFPMAGGMFQQPFPWGFPYGHHGQQYPNNFHSHHQKQRPSGSITEIEPSATPPSAQAPPPLQEVFSQLEAQQQQQAIAASTEEVQCTPTLPF